MHLQTSTKTNFFSTASGLSLSQIAGAGAKISQYTSSSEAFLDNLGRRLAVDHAAAVHAGFAAVQLGMGFRHQFERK